MFAIDTKKALFVAFLAFAILFVGMSSVFAHQVGNGNDRWQILVNGEGSACTGGGCPPGMYCDPGEDDLLPHNCAVETWGDYESCCPIAKEHCDNGWISMIDDRWGQTCVGCPNQMWLCPE